MSASESLKALQKKVIKAIEDAEVSEFFEKIPDVIRSRTRNGYGVNSSGNIVLLPPLAESTIDRRRSLENNGRLSGETTPFFSNLTESGNLLDAMRMKRTGKLKYEIAFDNRKKKNGLTPEQIKDYLEEKGFVFFKLANSERKKLEDNVAKKMQKEIEKIFR